MESSLESEGTGELGQMYRVLLVQELEAIRSTVGTRGEAVTGDADGIGKVEGDIFVGYFRAGGRDSDLTATIAAAEEDNSPSFLEEWTMEALAEDESVREDIM